MSADPFTALGLPVRPDLTDDDVRAAWRRVAAATHPDRADGGDPARFALAAAAYTDLRTAYGRGEAYADLAAGRRWHAPTGARPAQPAGPAVAAAGTAGSGTADSRTAGSGAAASEARAGMAAAASLASRVSRGRPALLGLRLAIAAAICAVSFAVLGAQPAAAGLATGAVTWLLLTARHDLAPPAAAGRPDLTGRTPGEDRLWASPWR